MPRRSIPEVMAANPRKPGEGAMAYQFRIGSIMNNPQDNPQTPFEKTVATVPSLVPQAFDRAIRANPIIGPVAGFMADAANQRPQGGNEPTAIFGVRDALGRLLNAPLPITTPGPAFNNFVSEGVKRLPQDLAVGMSTPNRPFVPQAAAATAPAPVRQPKPPVTITGDPDPVGTFMRAVRGPESANSNDPRLKNRMGSSASGFYQITDPTWKGAYRQTFGKAAANMSDAQILAARDDPQMQDRVMRTLGNNYVRSLQQAKLGINSTNMYMMHFLGPKAIPMMLSIDSGGGNTPVANFVSKEEIARNPWLQNGATLGSVYSTLDRAINGKGGGNSSSPYTDRVMGTIDSAGGLTTGYDPSYDQAALAQVDKAQAAALKPFSADVQLPDAPVMPELQTAAPTDFTQSDADLQKLRPAEITDMEKSRIRRQNIFKGIAQGLMASPEGVGVGRLLAMVGGGALAGRAAGDEEIRARTDKFDEQMARFNTALYNNDTMKARTIHEEMQANVNATNQRAMAQFQLGYNEWSKNTSVSYSNGNLITSTMDTKTRKVHITRVPDEAAVTADFALKRADVIGGIGARANAATESVAHMRDAAIIGAAGVDAQTNPNSPDATTSITTGMAFIAGQAVRDQSWTDLVGADTSKAIIDDARKYAMQMGIDPSNKDYLETVQRRVQSRLTGMALGDPVFGKKLMLYGGQARNSFLTDQYTGGKTTVKTGPKGSTTTTTMDAQ